MHAWTAIATFDFRLSGGFESVPHCLINLVLVVVGTSSSHDWRHQQEAGLDTQAHVKLVFLLCVLTVTRPAACPRRQRVGTPRTLRQVREVLWPRAWVCNPMLRRSKRSGTVIQLLWSDLPSLFILFLQRTRF